MNKPKYKPKLESSPVNALVRWLLELGKLLRMCVPIVWETKYYHFDGTISKGKYWRRKDALRALFQNYGVETKQNRIYKDANYEIKLAVSFNATRFTKEELKK